MSRVVYPIGEQDFKSIREAGKLYVDKTGFIPELLDHKFYFLSRPRRFGKSLFLSTLEYFFRGERHLFEGLAIDSYDDWNWEPHPVIRIDLTGENYTDPNGLQHRFNEIFSRYERQFSLASEPAAPYCGRREWESSGLATRFRELIYNTAEKYGKKVVILVDEYEKPLTDCLNNEELFKANHNALSAIYSVLKSADEVIELCFITGVTRFANLNIFSGLNNILDLSFNTGFGTICGITEEELKEYFAEGINKLAEAEDTDFEGAMAILKENYDGYHFNEKCPDIYNPYSILLSLFEGRTEAFWSATGTPSFLVRLLISKNYTIEDLDGITVTVNRLRGNNALTDDPVILFYQTGYLSIKRYDQLHKTFSLGFPNREVEMAFFEFILPYYLNVMDKKGTSFITDFADSILKGNPSKAMDVLKDFSASINYDIFPKPEMERHFQQMVYIFSRLVLPYIVAVRSEEHTSDGRIDVAFETTRYVYIIEIKRDSTPDQAIQQITDKDYALKYHAGGRQIFLIGVDFSTEKRRITDFKILKYN